MSTQTTDSIVHAADFPPHEFSPAEIAHFEEAGYAIVRGLAPIHLRETMAQVSRDALSGPVQPVEYEADVHYPGSPESRETEGGETVRRLLWAHSRHPVFTDWICYPGVVRRLQQLLGAQVTMPLAHHNCIMTKQPRYSSQTLWHQDIRFWSFQRPELVSVWLALGDETVENGCLSVIPGTHRMDLAPDRLDSGKFLDPTQPKNHELIERRIAVPLKPGDVLFFHGRTFHAAGSNQTELSKLSAVFTFRPTDNPPIPGTRSAAMPEMMLPVLS